VDGARTVLGDSDFEAAYRVGEAGRTPFSTTPID